MQNVKTKSKQQTKKHRHANPNITSSKKMLQLLARCKPYANKRTNNKKQVKQNRLEHTHIN